MSAWDSATPSNVRFHLAQALPFSTGTDMRFRTRRKWSLNVSPDQDLANIGDGLTTPVPPEDLIFLVIGRRDRRQFALSRRSTVQGMISLLGEVGVDYREFTSILDFGCGCGRILAGWEPFLAKDVTLLGCDINSTLVAFCQENIPFARSWTSTYLPPLQQVSNDSLDFVYAASVFSHVTESAARDWAEEMRRIIKPGGVLMISYNGSYYDTLLEGISPKGLRELKERGFYGHIHGRPDQTWLGSNDYATYMDRTFVNDLFTGFERIGLREGQIIGATQFVPFQDTCIFRRNA